MPRRWLPEWVTAFTDRHGKKRYRFRRKGYPVHSFRAQPGTEAFREEYAACLAAQPIEPPAVGADRAAPGSFDELIARYYRSPDFLNPGERTRAVYRGVIERWRETRTPSGRRYGAALVRDLTAGRVEEMMTAMLPHRTAANMLRKRLRALLDFAVRQGYVASNPVISTKTFAVAGTGFHSWTDEELAAFDTRHPVGTRARLAKDLLLWTGQRRGDVRLMGPGHIRGGRLVVTQEKTGAVVSLPIMPALAESIAAAASPGVTFLATERGQPFTRAGLGGWFRDRCDEAGLTHCSAHGLRKAAARRYAEAGCSNQEIKAWTGHTTDSEVARYTAAASQIGLSDAAAARLLQNLANRIINRNEG